MLCCWKSISFPNISEMLRICWGRGSCVTPLPVFTPSVVKPNQTRPDQNGPNQTKPNQTRPDPTKADQTRPDQTSPNQTRPKQTKPNPTKPDRTQPDQTRPNQITPDQTRPNHSKPDQSKAKQRVLCLPQSVHEGAQPEWGCQSFPSHPVSSCGTNLWLEQLGRGSSTREFAWGQGLLRAACRQNSGGSKGLGSTASAWVQSQLLRTDRFISPKSWPWPSTGKEGGRQSLVPRVPCCPCPKGLRTGLHWASFLPSLPFPSLLEIFFSFFFPCFARKARTGISKSTEESTWQSISLCGKKMRWEPFAINRTAATKVWDFQREFCENWSQGSIRELWLSGVPWLCPGLQAVLRVAVGYRNVQEMLWGVLGVTWRWGGSRRNAASAFLGRLSPSWPVPGGLASVNTASKRDAVESWQEWERTLTFLHSEIGRQLLLV